MKAPSAGTRRQIYLLTVLGALLILAVVRWGGKGSGSAGASAPRPSARTDSPGVEEDRSGARGRARARQEKKVAAEDVPFVSVGDLEPPRGRRPGDLGRNIFDVREPTKPPPPTPTPAPPPPPAPGSALFIGPMPPPPPTPTPVPPEVSFKFIGTFGPKDHPIAVLLAGDQLLNARAGDVVFDRFILRSIGYESVEIGFVGYPPAATKRLGITP
jgi:hypothetical protein